MKQNLSFGLLSAALILAVSVFSFSSCGVDDKINCTALLTDYASKSLEYNQAVSAKDCATLESKFTALKASLNKGKDCDNVKEALQTQGGQSGCSTVEECIEDMEVAHEAVMAANC